MDDMATRRSAPENYVSVVLDDRVRVEGVTLEVARELERLGAKAKMVRNGAVWELEFRDFEELGALLGQLRDLGILFSDAPDGWPPAAVFEDLRDQRLVTGSFNAVIWSGPLQWSVYER